MSNEADNDEISSVGKLKSRFGLDLPSRDLELIFPPGPKGRKGVKPILVPSVIVKEFNDRKNSLLQMFEFASKALVTLNSYSASFKQRFQVSRLYWRYCFSYGESILKTYRSGGGVPDSVERSQTLDFAYNSLEQLRKSLQLLFADIYHKPNLLYSGMRGQLNEISMLIFEVVSMQQQVGALRYRELSQTSWLVINKIYHVMREYESVDRLLPLTQTLLQTPSAVPENTLQSMFLRIQLIAYFDPLRYPTIEQNILYAFVRAQEKNAHISILEHAAKLGNSYLVVGHGRNQAPRVESDAREGDTPGTLISVRKIHSQLIDVFQDLMQSDKTLNQVLSGSIFSGIPQRNRLSIYGALFSRVREQDYTGVDLPAPKPVDIEVYGGFVRCFELKSDDKRAKDTRKVKQISFSLNQPSLNQDVENQWFYLAKDAKNVILQSQEMRTSSLVCVGSLMAFSADSDDQTKRIHRLGRVTRIARQAANYVVYDMRIVAEHAEAVGFIDLADQKEKTRKKVLPALLINNGSWQLLVHHAHVKFAEDKIGIVRGDDNYTVKVDRVLLNTNEFSMLQLGGEALGDLKPLFQAQDL